MPVDACVAHLRPRDDPAELRVELRAARIPYLAGLACHTWFVLRRAERCDRWEVWQRPDAGGTSFGHLHCNLLPPERGVGAGASWIECAWQGADAAGLAQRIEASPRNYPFLTRYRYWPGPNSNTYVQWVLGDHWRLGWTAPGRGFGVPARDALG